MSPRVVFDTTVVVSALLFTGGRLAWLRPHWHRGDALPLASRATVEELTRVLRYPKFQLSSDNRDELLAEYLPYCEIVKVTRKSKLSCRDKNDQPFLDLAEGGKADLLVTGDRDLLALAGQTRFVIETPAAYRVRVSGLQVDTLS
ncbi:MAG: putative toxin-antitoxin system toxin component, PIN family [Acidobacteriaceae bacterium]